MLSSQLLPRSRAPDARIAYRVYNRACACAYLHTCMSAPWRSSFSHVREKLVEKSFHEMKGDRDGKSAKTIATRHCLYSGVVVNDHMYPCPYIIFDSKRVIETYRRGRGYI